MTVTSLQVFETDFQNSELLSVPPRPFHSLTFRCGGRITLETEGVTLLSEADCITYVPVSALRLVKRGYDQSRLLAEEVGRRMGVPVYTLLEKTRHTLPQSRLSGARRAAHVQGVYRLAGRQELSDKTVLLIDDIVTTGSTISECAAVLEAHGARVICAALAHGT